MSDSLITKIKMVQALNIARPSMLAMFEEGRMTADEDEKLGAALDAVADHVEALEAENARLREVGEDALKALPVLRTMLESAGLAAGAIVAEGMLAHARAALAGKAVT